jgi:hypothetical protein
MFIFGKVQEHWCLIDIYLVATFIDFGQVASMLSNSWNRP